MQHALPVAEGFQAQSPIHVLFGTQTGTSELVASDVVDALTANGLPLGTLRDLADVDIAELADLGTVLVVCSSYGDGWFPDTAAPFYEAITAAGAPDLGGLTFAVLGFGDSGYDDFCAAGRLLDAAFAARGAQRLHPLGRCDVVYEDAAEAWTNGVVSALLRRAQPQPVVAAPRATQVQILFGTQTGTTEMVAGDVADALAAADLKPAPVRGLDDVTAADLQTTDVVLFICSSYGDGGFPDAAQAFYDSLCAADAPRLEGLRYSVLAFGDSGYDDFCAAGRKLDQLLEALGAERILDRVDCDIVYEAAAERWTKAIVARLPGLTAQPAVPAASGAAPPVGATAVPRQKWTRSHPHTARLVENRLLSSLQSTKEIRHFRIDLGSDGPDYAAGDTLNILPVNDPRLVEGWLIRTGIAPETTVPGHDRPFAQMLRDGLEISVPSRELVALLAERGQDAEVSRLHANGDRAALAAWLWNKDALDLLALFPDVKLSMADLATVLRPLQHRSYSVASSARVARRQVDLTVSVVRYDSLGRQHGGVASTYLADRLSVGDDLRVFVTPNTAFRVPADPAVPMIMVGPGAGIAPFIGFLQERAAMGATGMNWLFFGDRNRAHDFIHQAQLEAWQADGVLNRLDLAFSRDGEGKVYVQDRMRAAAADLFAALEAGGHLYVCGDALRMAQDVEAALHDIIAEQGKMDAAGAHGYVARLRREKRYLRDVY